MKMLDVLRNSLKMLQDVYKTQLNASIPAGLAQEFEVQVYHANVPRFATQSAILVVIDLCSLAAYSFYGLQGDSVTSLFIIAHILKIIMMASLFVILFFMRQSTNHTKGFFARDIDVFYPALYGASELLFFMAGPQGTGALVRFLAVPFIMGTVPIMKQSRIIALESVTLLLFHGYLLGFTPYGQNVYYIAYFLNVGIVFVGAVLASNIIYSVYVNNFMRMYSEQKAHEEMFRLNARLDILSRRDQLTGLSNRRDFDSFMEMSWPGEQKRAKVLSIVMIDIDHFKAFNDRFGHVAGDDCLIKVSQTIKSCLHNDGYMFARYGGEEFIVAAFGEDHAQMLMMAERTRQSVEKLRIENPDSAAGPYLTISLGIATQNIAEIQDYNTIVNIADECLYYAKAGGRNRLVHIDHQTNLYKDIQNKTVSREITDELPRLGPFNSSQFQQAIKGFSLDCTFVYSRKHEILEFSAFAQELLGMPHSVALPSLEKVLEILPISQEDRPAVAAELRRTFDRQSRAMELEARIIDAEGHKNWVAIRLKCLYAEDGTLEIASGTFFNIQNVLDYSNYTYEQAMVDSLTQLPNRKKFYADMKALLAKKDSKGCVALFDIDSFKSINGIFSHTIGDRTLKKVGSTVRKMVGDMGCVYHYTVDQYAVLLPDSEEDGMRLTVERIQQYFATCGITVKGIALKIGFNVGALSYHGGVSSLDELMLNLEIALHKAKSEHKQSFRLFDDEDKTEYMNGIRLEKELAEAVRNNFARFALHYQPLFTQDGSVCLGAEALLRWTRENGEEISPLTVVPTLENNGLIIKVGRWILETACRQCCSWIDAGAPEAFYVHVNLSAHQIDNSAFAQEVLSVLEANRLQPRNLVLEITESSFLSETTKSIGVLHALRSAGVRIAVDDFGTGYSSLSYLRSLPADVIKIDRSFLADVNDDAAARKILLAVADLTRSMGYKVCMEGVETKEQMSFLQDTFVDLMQGFLLGRPVPAESFSQQWLKVESLA